MNKSETIGALAKALATAQGEIENASKNAKNPHFKSNYADLAEVINTVRPIMSKHGISISQFPAFDSGLASVETIVMHHSGEWMSGVSSAPVGKQDAQGVGSAITYLRRYSLASIAGIAQEDDDGNSAVGGQRQQQRSPDPVAQQEEARKQALMAAVHKHQATIQAVKQGIADDDMSSAAEAWFELSKDDMHALWVAPSRGGPFTTREREIMKTSEFRQAYYGVPTEGETA